MKTSTTSQGTLFDQTSSQLDFPAKISVWPESEQDWQDLEAVFSGKPCESYESFVRCGRFLRMSQVFSVRPEEPTLPASFSGWGNSGSFNPSLGLVWTQDISEWRSGAEECTLFAVLESEAPKRFYLSPTAAPSQKAGPEVARALANGSVSSGYRYDPNGEDYIVANAVSASAGHHGHSSPRGDGSDNLVCNALGTASGGPDDNDAQGNHLVAAPITASYGKQVDSSDRNGGPPNLVCQHGVAYALPSVHRGVGNGHNTNYVSAPPYSNGVRDIAGISEGLDDTRFPLLPKGLDSPRYRALGNAVTVSVARWIGERIKAVHLRTSARVEVP